MLNVFLVSAHEDPRSVSGAMQNATLSVLARSGHNIRQTNLYAQEFNPIASKLDFNTSSGVHASYILEQQRAINTGSGFSPDIQAEMDKLKQSDLLILNFHLYWSAPPAVISGWLQKVLAMGFAWGANQRYQNGLMRGKKALVTCTVDDPISYYSPEGMHGATVHQHLYGLLHSTLAFCGFDVLEPVIILNTIASTQQEKDTDIAEYSRLLQSIEQWDDYIYKF